MADKDTAITPAREGGRLSPARSPRTWSGGPFTMFRRMADEMDRMFDDFGWGAFGTGPSLLRRGGLGTWAPEVEVFQKNNQLTIRADLPGLKKNEVSVEVGEGAVTIHGERKHEHEEEREGVYRSERSYGTFYRVIPLPEGAITDQAKAAFREGVLEITMPAPPAHQGRRLEITEGTK
jgi:HSP20 family protein